MHRVRARVLRFGAGLQTPPKPRGAESGVHRRSELIPTDILGCLSLPGDVLAEARLMPPLAPGDVLAFPNAGAYGLAASPWLFPLPSGPRPKWPSRGRVGNRCGRADLPIPSSMGRLFFRNQGSTES